jgi:hypothetical protein
MHILLLGIIVFGSFCLNPQILKGVNPKFDLETNPILYYVTGGSKIKKLKIIFYFLINLIFLLSQTIHQFHDWEIGNSEAKGEEPGSMYLMYKTLSLPYVTSTENACMHFLL